MGLIAVRATWFAAALPRSTAVVHSEHVGFYVRICFLLQATYETANTPHACTHKPHRRLEFRRL